MNFMLPLHLSSDDAVDIVLVVELTPAGNYQGQTILTCDQAYIDARLVCSLKSHWLDLRRSDKDARCKRNLQTERGNQCPPNHNRIC